LAEYARGTDGGLKSRMTAVYVPVPKPLVNTSRLATNAFPNQGSVNLDALVRCKSLQRTKEAARSGPHLADSLTSYYLALAGGTMPFIRRYSTI
jgi:hypothetical protein